MIIKNEIPILEYSTETEGILSPKEAYDYEDGYFPKLCFMTFFGEVFKAFGEKYGGEEIGGYYSEMCEFPVWKQLCAAAAAECWTIFPRGTL